MGKNVKTPVTIDGVEYTYEEMTSQQQQLVNHLVDLDRKINNARFNLEQLSVGRDAFMNALKTSLIQQQVEAAEGEELPGAAG